MPPVFGRMFNLTPEFFIGPKIPPTFYVIAQSCPYRYELAYMDKRTINVVDMERHVYNSVKRSTFPLI